MAGADWGTDACRWRACGGAGFVIRYCNLGGSCHQMSCASAGVACDDDRGRLGSCMPNCIQLVPGPTLHFYEGGSSSWCAVDCRAGESMRALLQSSETGYVTLKLASSNAQALTTQLTSSNLDLAKPLQVRMQTGQPQTQHTSALLICLAS